MEVRLIFILGLKMTLSRLRRNGECYAMLITKVSAFTDNSVDAARTGRNSPLTYLDRPCFPREPGVLFTCRA
jgi:hypothetical protein